MGPEDAKNKNAADAPSASRKVLGGFEILSRLGRGGMGTVYKARQISMDRLVALKILDPKFARDEKFVGRFEREARAAGKLSHPNIVSGIDVGEAEGLRYFAMEYVKGETLTDRIGEKGKLPPREAARIAAQVAAALGHAHSNGLVHRDVKPGNILLTEDGTAKLCDLGLARSTGEEDHNITVAGTALGTPNYISPEQVEGHGNVDGRSDLYSLGATIYYMVAGQPPFSAPTAARVMSMHLTDVPPPLSELVPGLHPGLILVISRLLKKKPDERYTSADDLVKDLESVAAGGMPRSFAAAAERRRQSTGPLRGATRRTAPVDAVIAARDAERANWFRGWRLAVVIASPILVAAAAFFALSLMDPGPTEAERAAAKAERAAREAWNTSIARILEDEPTRAEAERILRALDAFGATHGTTRFVDTKADDIARYRTFATMAIEGTGGTPAAPATPEEEIGRLFTNAEVWSAAHPDDFEKAAERFRKVAARAKELEKSAWVSKAEREAVRLVKARASAVERAFGDIKKKARLLAAKRDFDGALAAAKPDAAPLAFSAELAPRIEALSKKLRASAGKAFREPLARTRAHLAAGETEKGFAALAALEKMRYAPRAADVAQLAKKLNALVEARARAVAERLAAAHVAFEKTLDAFDRALKRDAADRDASLPRVSSLLDRAKRDAKLEPVTARVTALAALGDALARVAAAEAVALKELKDGKKKVFRTRAGREIVGVVQTITAEEIVLRFREGGGLAPIIEGERRVRIADLTPAEHARLSGDFKPEAPAEHLALALWSLSTGNANAAAAAIEKAKAHPLAARYAPRAKAVPKSGDDGAAKEKAARAAIQAFNAAVVVRNWKQVIELGDAFLAKYGKTDCGRANAARVNDLVAGAKKVVSPGAFVVPDDPNDPGAPVVHSTPASGERVTLSLRQGAPVPALGIDAYRGVTDTSLGRHNPALKGPERGMGGGTGLGVGFGQGKERRCVIRFDLSALPKGARVERATLVMYGRGPGKGTIGVHRVTRAWVPSEKHMEWDAGASWTFRSGKRDDRVRWTTPGSDYDETTDWGRGRNGLVCAPMPWALDKPIAFDLTPLVRVWVEGKAPNYGVLLKPEKWSGTDSTWLGSCESENPPVLKIIFIKP